jgi:hypothetical protein
MKENQHNQAIPPSAVQAAEAALDAQLQALSAYASPLTPEERQTMLKLGPKTFMFVETAHTLARENPGLTSKAFDIGIFDVDFADAHILTGLLNKTRQLLELLEDIVMTAGSEAHRAALEFYADVKAAAARNVPEARAVYEALKAVYPSRGGRKSKHEE